MMTAPALGAGYEMWADCPDKKGPVSDCKGCSFSCFKDGWEVKECKCTCDDDGSTDKFAKFWYSCDKTSCKDSDDCKAEDPEDKCDFLSSYQLDRCGDKSSKSKCKVRISSWCEC